MTNIIRINAKQTDTRQAVLTAVELSVRAALSAMSNAEIKDLIMSAYHELTIETEMQRRKAA